MPADFGINTQLISDSQLKIIIQDLIECINGASNSSNDPNFPKFEVNLDDPGIAAFVAGLIRSIEKGLVASFEPLIALINVIKEAIAAGLGAIKVFIDKIIKVINGLTDLVSPNPVEGIINFLVGKVIQPFVDNLNIPFPTITAIIEIVIKSIELGEKEFSEWLGKIDFQKWIREKKIVIPQKLQNKLDAAIRKGENAEKKVRETIQKGLTLYQKTKGQSQIAFLKLLEVILIPIKFAYELIKKVIEFVSKLVGNVFDAIAKITEIISNPVKFILDLISDIFGSIFSKLLLKLLGINDQQANNIQNEIIKYSNTSELINQVTDAFTMYIQKLFTSGLKKSGVDEWLKTLPAHIKPIFEKMMGFINLITCFLTWFISLISNPTIILTALLGINLSSFKPPAIKYFLYNAKKRTLIANSNEGLKENDLAKIFKPGMKLKIYDEKNRAKTGEIISVNKYTILLKEDIFNGNDKSDGKFEILL